MHKILGVAFVVVFGAAAACGGSSGSGLSSSGSSGSSTSSGGAGSSGASGGGPNDPFGGASTCSSQVLWARGDRGSPLMHPGSACIACHATNGGPRLPLTISGTVYPTGHEPDDCNGVDGTTTAVTVVITDANGAVFNLPVNAAGNFYSQSTAIASPFHAKVVSGGNERAMVAAQTSGDCNSCHTDPGASSAPGRIVVP